MDNETTNQETQKCAASGRSESWQQIVLDVMRKDDVPIAKLTRAYIRCAIDPAGAWFRAARRCAARTCFDENVRDGGHLEIMSVLEQEETSELLLARAAVDGLVLGRPESWFAAAESKKVLDALVGKTYPW